MKNSLGKVKKMAFDMKIKWPIEVENITCLLFEHTFLNKYNFYDIFHQDFNEIKFPKL